MSDTPAPYATAGQVGIIVTGSLTADGPVVAMQIGPNVLSMPAGQAISLALALLRYAGEATSMALAYDVLLTRMGQVEALAAIQEVQTLRATTERAAQSGLIVPKRGN